MWGQSTERPGLGCGARKGEEENVTRLVFFTNGRARGRGQVVVKQSGVFRESVR